MFGGADNLPGKNNTDPGIGQNGNLWKRTLV